MSSFTRAKVSEIVKKMSESQCGGSSKAKDKFLNLGKTTSQKKNKTRTNTHKLKKENPTCSENNQYEKISRLAGKSSTQSGKELIVPADVRKEHEEKLTFIEPWRKSEVETKRRVYMDFDPSLKNDCIIPLENVTCVMEDNHEECIPEHSNCNNSEESLNDVIERNGEIVREELTGNMFIECKDPQIEDTREGGSIARDNLNILSTNDILNLELGGQSCKRLRHVETSPPITEEGYISPFSSPDVKSSTIFKTVTSETRASFIPNCTQSVKCSEGERKRNVFEFGNEVNVLGNGPKYMTRVTAAGMLMAGASSSILSVDERKTSKENVRICQDKVISTIQSPIVSSPCNRIGTHLNWEKDNFRCVTDSRYGSTVIDFTPDYTPRIQRIKVSQDQLSGIQYALVPIPESARTGNVLVEVRYHRVFSPCKVPHLLDSSCYVLPSAQVADVPGHHRGCNRSLMNQFAATEGSSLDKSQHNNVGGRVSDSSSGEGFTLCSLPDTPEDGKDQERNYHCFNSQRTEREAQATENPSTCMLNSQKTEREAQATENPSTCIFNSQKTEREAQATENPSTCMFNSKKTEREAQATENPSILDRNGDILSEVHPVSVCSSLLSEKPVEEVVSVKPSHSLFSQPKSSYCHSQVLAGHRRALRLLSVSKSSFKTRLCVNHGNRRQNLKRLNLSYVDLYCPVCVMTLDDLILCSYYEEGQYFIPEEDVVTSSQESSGKQTRQYEFEFYTSTISEVFPSFKNLLPDELPTKCAFHGITGPDWRFYQSPVDMELFDQSSQTVAGSVPATLSHFNLPTNQAAFQSTFKGMDDFLGTAKTSSSFTVSRPHIGISGIVEPLRAAEAVSPSYSSDDMFGPLDLEDLQIEKMEKVDHMQRPGLENEVNQKNRNNLNSWRMVQVKRKKSSKRWNSGGLKKLKFKGSIDQESRITHTSESGNETSKIGS
ncbi:uncharacterized protein LOC143024369 [Oratosquilla oratoria]|uniref:uncharacterized protein LOC143024369 n=1 Tax=Oratosquilla oratoria TaxID=337810 RepID=UPI003F75C7D6